MTKRIVDGVEIEAQVMGLLNDLPDEDLAKIATIALKETVTVDDHGNFVIGEDD